MATTITMKLIMAFFVLINFSGLVITLTSPKVMSNDNNDYEARVGPFAPLRLPYNSTSNIYAKPSQAVRAPTMKQLPRPTTIHFFERSQQIPLTQWKKKKTSKKTTTFAAWRKSQAKKLLAETKIKNSKLAADLAASHQQRDALAAQVAELLNVQHQRDELAAQVARIEEERAQLARLLAAAVRNNQPTWIRPAQEAPAPNPMTMGQFFDLTSLPSPNNTNTNTTTLEPVAKVPTHTEELIDAKSNTSLDKKIDDQETIHEGEILEELINAKLSTSLNKTDDKYNIHEDKILEKLPASLRNATDLTQGWMWSESTTDNNTNNDNDDEQQQQQLNNVLKQLPASLRNATDLNHGWMWSDDNDDNHRDVLHQLPASLRNATDLSRGWMWSQ